ncbi:MAG: DUF4019 domain-containing protein [Acidobacteriota bacterium]
MRRPGRETRLRRFAPLAVVAALCLGAAPAPPTEKPPRKDDVPRAREAARSFLVPIDAGLYADTWENAAAYTKSIVPKPAWENGIRIIRSPLGDVRSRALKKSDYTRSLAGAPIGEYVIVQFETKFEKRPEPAAETVVTMRQKDGAWKVSGYFIQ